MRPFKTIYLNQMPHYLSHILSRFRSLGLRKIKCRQIGMPLVFAILMLTSVASPASVKNRPPPIDVAVQGQAITWSDILGFFNGVFSPKLRLQRVEKEAAEMPPDAPLVSYQGRTRGTPFYEIIWISKSPRADVFSDSYVAAIALAVLDAGNAGPTFQAIYAKAPPDRASRLTLGDAIAKALTSASDQSAEYAANQADWIRVHIVRGITRAAAYAMLKSRGVVAYNWMYVKGKPISLVGCSTMDQSSGAWPYKNEPLPVQRGVCAENHPTKPIVNPNAEIELDGAFNLGCSWKTQIVIKFDNHDRVTNVSIDKPLQGCL